MAHVFGIGVPNPYRYCHLLRLAVAPTAMAALPSAAIFDGNCANWLWQFVAAWRTAGR
jgi:hypothetical protein